MQCCSEKCLDETRIIPVIKKRRKCSMPSITYVVLFIYFVPSVVCDKEWKNSLTYKRIYNNSYFVNNPRPYIVPFSNNFNINIHRNSNDLKPEKHEILIDRNEQSSFSTNKLLVGFARDPFRLSIPADDYIKGIREQSTSDYRSEGRGKRGVIHLYNMINCATGCDPLSYKGYGCYCGFLGSGKPTDGIDRCCQIHDNCYEGIYCPFFTVYFQPYYWKCYHGEPLCALENRLSQNKYFNSCAARLCECDRQFAMCVQHYPCPKQPAYCHSSPLRFFQNILKHGK